MDRLFYAEVTLRDVPRRSVQVELVYVLAPDHREASAVLMRERPGCAVTISTEPEELTDAGRIITFGRKQTR